MRTDLEGVFDEAGCVGSVHAVRLSDGAEAGHDPNQPWVLASVVKVPIGLEFFAQADVGALDPSATVALTPAARTPGPVGISQFQDPAVLSLRDLSYLMLTISDNAATDAITTVVGIGAVNQRLHSIGCQSTLVREDLQSMLNGVANDLGHDSYDQLIAAQRGDLGPRVKAAATDPRRIDRCRALDPEHTSHTTARDATRLLAAIHGDTAASPAACTALLEVLAQQVTRRLEPAVPDGGHLAAKSGGLFGRIRNEIGVITDPDGEAYAVAVLTRAHKPFDGSAHINAAIATAAATALNQLRRRSSGGVHQVR